MYLWQDAFTWDICDMTHSHVTWLISDLKWFMHAPLEIFAALTFVNLCRNTVQHNEMHCNTLQHTATHCNTLQHTTTHYNTRIHLHGAKCHHTHDIRRVSAKDRKYVQPSYNTIQVTATHCNTLQHATTHYNTMQDALTLAWREVPPHALHALRQHERR